MRKLNKKAAKILDALTAGLNEPGDARKIDNAPGAYMAACVNRIGESFYSVAHYFVQNGDMMADPDVVFWRNDVGDWYPVEITQHALGTYDRYVEFGDKLPVRYNRRGQKDLALFCNTWMQNIKWQQEDLSPKAPPPAPEPVADADLDCVYCGAKSASSWCGDCDRGGAVATGPQAAEQLSLF